MCHVYHSYAFVFFISRCYTATHDVVNASAHQGNNEGALNTSCTFVQNTTASGYLAIISDVNCNQDTIYLIEYNTAGTNDPTDGVGPGDYRIAFYDLESDGLPPHPSDDKLIGSAKTADVTLSNGIRKQSLHGMCINFIVLCSVY